MTLTYAAPIADESTTAIGFTGTQSQGVASATQNLTVTNDGSAPLIVSDVVLGGTNPGDYLVDDGCQQQVAAGTTCAIGIRFAPQAAGASSATLTLVTNAVVAPPVVALSGTGGSPAAQGPTGAGRRERRQRSGGRAGQGPPRHLPCGKKTVIRKHHRVRVTKQKCTTKTVSGSASFTTTGASEHATISRAGVVFARGAATPSGALVLRALRPIAPGRYLLTLRLARGGRASTIRMTATIA